MKILYEEISKEKLIKMFPNIDMENLLKAVEEKIQMYKNEDHIFKNITKNVNMKWPLFIKMLSLFKKKKVLEGKDSVKTFLNFDLKFNIIKTLLLMSAIMQNKNLLNALTEDNKDHIDNFLTLEDYHDMLTWFKLFPTEEIFEVLTDKYYGDLGFNPDFSSAEYDIYHLLNHVMARKIGGDTKWCVSSPTSGKGHFKNYTNRKYSLYALVYKNQSTPVEKFLLAIKKKEDPKLYKKFSYLVNISSHLPKIIEKDIWATILKKTKKEVNDAISPIENLQDFIEIIKSENVSTDLLVKTFADVLLTPDNIQNIIENPNSIISSKSYWIPFFWKTLEKIYPKLTSFNDEDIIEEFYSILNDSFDLLDSARLYDNISEIVNKISREELKEFQEEYGIRVLEDDEDEEEEEDDDYIDINDLSNYFDLMETIKYAYEVKDRENEDVDSNNIERIFKDYRNLSPEPKQFVDNYFFVKSNLDNVNNLLKLIMKELKYEYHSNISDLIYYFTLKKEKEIKRLSDYFTFIKNHNVTRFFRELTTMSQSRHPHEIFQHPIFIERMNNLINSMSISLTQKEIEKLKFINDSIWNPPENAFLTVLINIIEKNND